MAAKCKLEKGLLTQIADDRQRLNDIVGEIDKEECAMAAAKASIVSLKAKATIFTESIERAEQLLASAAVKTPKGTPKPDADADEDTKEPQ